MKKINLTKYALGLAAAATIAIACSPTEEIDKIKDSIGIRINTELMSSYAYIKVYDVNDGSTPPNAKLEVTSANESNVFQVSGSKDLTLVNGRIGIGLHPRAFSGSEPVSVDLLFTADDCDPVTKTVVFDPAFNGVIDLDVPLLNYANLPESVQVEETSAELSEDGTLEEDMNLEVEPTAESDVAMDVEVPAGTQFVNDAGEVLQGGSVTLNTVAFDATDGDVLESAFPGGLTADNIVVGNDTVSGGFVPAGFASFEITVGGEEATSFTQPVEVKTSIAPAYNPATNEQIKAGDTLEIYSYDDDAAQWTYEGDATVVDGENGLEVSYKASHFSTWSFGYKVPICDPAIDWSFISGWLNAYPGLITVVNFYVPGSDQYVGGIVTTGSDIQQGIFADKTLLNALVLPSYTVRYTFLYQGTYIWNGQFSVANPCDGVVLDEIEFDTSLIQDQEYIEFNATGKCASKPNYEFRPTFTVEYRLSNSGEPYRKLGDIKNGSFRTSSLEVGTAYDFYVLYDGEVYEKTNVVFDSNVYDFAFDVPEDICATLP